MRSGRSDKAAMPARPATRTGSGAHRAARLPDRHQPRLGRTSQQGTRGPRARLDRLPARQLGQAMGIVAERGEARHQHLAGRLRGAGGSGAKPRGGARAAAGGEADRGVLALRHALEGIHAEDQGIGAGVGAFQRGAEAEGERRGRVLLARSGATDGQQGQEKDQAATQGHAEGASMRGGK